MKPYQLPHVAHQRRPVVVHLPPVSSSEVCHAIRVEASSSASSGSPASSASVAVLSFLPFLLLKLPQILLGLFGQF